MNNPMTQTSLPLVLRQTSEGQTRRRRFKITRMNALTDSPKAERQRTNERTNERSNEGMKERKNDSTNQDNQQFNDSTIQRFNDSTNQRINESTNERTERNERTNERTTEGRKEGRKEQTNVASTQTDSEQQPTTNNEEQATTPTNAYRHRRHQTPTPLTTHCLTDPPTHCRSTAALC